MAVFWHSFQDALLTAELKYDRAQRFSSAAHSALIDFERQKLHKLRHDGRYRLHSWALEVNTNLPPSIMMNVGDAIHNWRSVLDHCAYAFWRMDNSSLKTSKLNDTEVYFPITSRKRDFIKKVDELGLYRDARQAFLNVEAFKGGYGDSLWCLSKIDNIDKHRLVPSANIVIEVSDLVIRENKGHQFTFTQNLAPVQIIMSSGQVKTSLRNRAGVEIFGHYLFPAIDASLNRFIDDSASSSKIDVELAEYVPLLNHHCGRNLVGSLGAFSVGVFGVLTSLKRVLQERIAN